LPAQALVVRIVAAQRVAVHQQHRLAGQLHGKLILAVQRGSGGLRERLAEQEIPVAVHQVHPGAGVGQLGQGVGHAPAQRVGQPGVVADPGLEQVAQDP